MAVFLSRLSLTNTPMKVIPIRSLKTTQLEPDLSERFRIRDVETILDGKDMSQEVHRHDFFFILVLKKGAGTHEIDFQSHQIRNHSIFVMRPGQVHQLTLDKKCEGYLIEFKTDFFSSNNRFTTHLLRRASRTNHCIPDKKRFDKMLTILEDIFQEYENRDEEYLEVIKANFSVFLIELIRNRQNRKSISNTYEQDRLEQFQELVEKHIATHKQVSQYADMLHLSTYQLNAITKATLGKTSSKVIDEYIVLEAKRYLLSTTSQVNQTAFHLGFEDVSYFIRFFKRHTGYSPETFRLKFK